MIEEPTDPRERLLREGTRVSDRLRSLPLSARLTANAGQVRTALDELAAVEARLRGVPPARVPQAPDAAVADQLLVLTRAVLDAAPPWERELVAEAAEVVARTRRSLV